MNDETKQSLEEIVNILKSAKAVSDDLKLATLPWYIKLANYFDNRQSKGIFVLSHYTFLASLFLEQLIENQKEQVNEPSE